MSFTSWVDSMRALVDICRKPAAKSVFVMGAFPGVRKTTSSARRDNKPSAFPSAVSRRQSSMIRRICFSSVTVATLISTRLLEFVDGVAGVAVDLAIDRARSLLDHMHRRILRAGIAPLVAKLRAQLATAVFRRVVDQTNFFHVGADAVRDFFPQPLIERVLVKIVIRRLLVVARRHLALLGVAGDFLLWKRADQVRLTLRVEIFVFGQGAAGATLRARGRIQVRDALRVEVV